MDRRKKLLYLAVSVAILGTASLYLLSASLEHGNTCNGEGAISVKTVLNAPEDYLDRDVRIKGNVSETDHYGNITVFYLREGDYSLRCVSFENITVNEGKGIVAGTLKYHEKWGTYEFVVESVEY